MGQISVSRPTRCRPVVTCNDEWSAHAVVRPSFCNSLQDINPNATDEFGRTWPGNIAAAFNQSYVQCWDDSKVIQITLIVSACRLDLSR